MTATSYPEFKKLFDRIPKDRLPYVHFIPIRCGSKVPIGNWKGKAHLTLYECKDVLKTGGNIAVAGIPKGIMFLDIDVDKSGQLQATADILSKIPKTFRVRSTSGGFHYYFINNGDWDNQKFYMELKYLTNKIENIKEDKIHYDKKDITHSNPIIEIGELRTNWQYVVAVGSWTNAGTYRVIEDVPINQFTGDITVYFRSGNVKDLSPNRPAPTPDKKGLPINDHQKDVLERLKEQKEGIIEPDKVTNAQRKEELLAKLAARGIRIG